MSSSVRSSISEFAISLDESVAFARLSGDFNPLHVDPAHARRTQFGQTVVHGIHAILKAVDGLEGVMSFEGFELMAIACTFTSPIPTDATVRIEASRDLTTGRLRIFGKVDGRSAFSVAMDLRSRLAVPAGSLTAADFEPALPQVHTLPKVEQEGAVRIQLGGARIRNLFPRLARTGDLDWIANLVATTRIVGMECPGMHSIFSGLKLRRSENSVERMSEWMRYRVEKSDPRFRMLRLSVSGGTFEGSIEAFLRPPPVDQMLLADVMVKVPIGTFGGQCALVVGGSRGLGELTAKILIAGGADVTITYATGGADAERIRGEAVMLGRRCATAQLDVAVPIDVASAGWLTTTGFSHIYFFASPHISMNRAEHWNHELYERFCRVYVRGFASVAEGILAGTSVGHLPARFLFPSTVFLDRPETGFAEYVAAKAAGESLCSYLGQEHRTLFARPRLPRMRTDQTSGLQNADVAESFEVLQKVLIDFHAAHPEASA